MTGRTFGVEIECGFEPRLSAGQVRDRIALAGLGEWVVGHDGTDIEAKTPILSGQKGLATLKKALHLFQIMGGHVTRADGLHVHHGAPEFVNDMNAIRKLVKSWHANQDAIELMVHERRLPHGYSYQSCPRWDDDDLVQLDQMGYVGGFSRKSLNINALARHGTIELRLHEGTLDFEEAKAWIMFGQKFIENVVKNHEPTGALGSTDALLKHIRLGYKSGAFLREKARVNARQLQVQIPVTEPVAPARAGIASF